MGIEPCESAICSECKMSNEKVNKKVTNLKQSMHTRTIVDGGFLDISVRLTIEIGLINDKSQARIFPVKTYVRLYMGDHVLRE